MRASARELLLTTLATVAIAAAAFAARRIAFPDPAIEGRHCPTSLGEPAYGRCIASYHRSFAERDCTASRPASASCS